MTTQSYSPGDYGRFNFTITKKGKGPLIASCVFEFDLVATVQLNSLEFDDAVNQEANLNVQHCVSFV